VRVTASEPATPPAPAANTADTPLSASWVGISPSTATSPPPDGPSGSRPAASTPPGGAPSGPAASASVAASRPPPSATLVLSSGQPVNPPVDRTPRTARPAPAPPTLTATPTPPPETPDPQLLSDGAATATAWLSALCWYDYRGSRDDNTR